LVVELDLNLDECLRDCVGALASPSNAVSISSCVSSILFLFEKTYWINPLAFSEFKEFEYLRVGVDSYTFFITSKVSLFISICFLGSLVYFGCCLPLGDYLCSSSVVSSFYFSFI